MRRTRIVGALAAATLAVAGCSAHQRQTAWCAYHIYRLQADVRHHHMGWAAFQGIMSAHKCTQALHSRSGQ